LTETEEAIVLQVIKELKWRLQLLVDIGVGYLSLDRLTHTLSGGEMQRINLSTALGSSLVGTLYVLDEPSIGLHPRDTQRLLTILRKLKSIGNTVIIVEHDPEIIRSGDYVIDLGPQAGEFGGEITFTGDTTQLLDSKTSLTGMYLSGRKKIELPSVPAKSNGHKITLINPTQHNLKINKIDFPLGCMVVVTGVSGSGKSTLILDVLYNALKKLRGGFEGSITNLSAVLGYEHINAVELVDQSSIGKSSRSTPVTYIKAFDYIRELFASTPSAVQLGLRPGYFSFNVPGGRCEACEGEGSVTVDMQFLPDVHLECESCKGTRYKKEARSILYNGKSIVDVLDMTVDEALTFFKSTPKLESKLSMLKEVGLGYLRLGQPSNMLSAGESQRIKLSNHLESTDTSHTLFIFDEPTTGLHLDDISRLLKCFRKLVAAGHSIIIIEHNLHVIASSDWIIDLGPEGGDEGGRLVAAGTPLELTKHRDSYTGAALAEFYKTWQ
jgi:excinuclease ABC subunit A